MVKNIQLNYDKGRKERIYLERIIKTFWQTYDHNCE